MQNFLGSGFFKPVPQISLWLAPTLIGAMLCIASCKPSGGFSGGAKREGGTNPPVAEVQVAEEFTIASVRQGLADIVLLLDTSISMKEEISSLESGLQGFVDEISQGETGIDYQIFVIASTSKVNFSLKDAEKLDLRNSEVNSHSALWNAYHFLEGNTDKVPGGHLKLRSGAVKELVVLTDDDATDITASNFGPYLKGQKDKLGEVRVNGFVGLPTSKVTSTCKISKVGTSYLDLSRDSQIGGSIRDVCNDDWTALLNDFAKEVKTRATSTAIFELKRAPTSKSNIKVTIDGTNFSDFTYNQSTKSVIIQTKNLSKSSHRVIVTYS